METVIQLLMTNHIPQLSSSAVLRTRTYTDTRLRAFTEGCGSYWDCSKIHADWINGQRLCSWTQIHCAEFHQFGSVVLSCCSKWRSRSCSQWSWKLCPGILDKWSFPVLVNQEHTIHILMYVGVCEWLELGYWSNSQLDHIPFFDIAPVLHCDHCCGLFRSTHTERN